MKFFFNSYLLSLTINTQKYKKEKVKNNKNKNKFILFRAADNLQTMAKDRQKGAKDISFMFYTCSHFDSNKKYEKEKKKLV